ncbi:MAG: MarR family transcriptional regulator [Cyclobacteriaceae bacterium]
MASLDILINIRRIVRSINLESKKIQKELGLSIPQLLCLKHLSESPDYQTTHRELMQLLSLNSSTVTGIVNRLEKKSFVARLPRPDDRRVTAIAITSNGLKLLQSAPNVLHNELIVKIDNLSTQEQESVNRSLQLIIKAMEIEDLEASPVITAEEPIVEDS